MSQPWCDPSQPLEVRVADLVSRIQDEEVVGLFSNGAAGVPSLGIPRYQWWSEALHGVGDSPGVTFSGNTPFATSFPQVLLTSSSLNSSLFGMIGDAISTEARAFNNQGHAGNTFWTPNINIFRDPRWGRGQETPGEDPYVNSEYAAHFVPGMQGGTAPKYIKASSCLKHYLAYSLEDWHGVNRHEFNAIVSAQDLGDTYLPPFQSGVQRGNASGLMCSYNAVNGVPSCANKPYLEDLVRSKWGFDGYVTSDCGAVNDVEANHHYTSGDNTTFAVLDAGMDSDCGGYLGSHMQKAIRDGAVTKQLYQRALTNMFRVRMRLGQFDPAAVQPYMQIGTEDINTPAHQQLALEAAQQGIVLLKNDMGALPWGLSNVKTVAVVGPHGDDGGVLQGNYQGTAPFLITVKQGVAAFANATFTQGCDTAGSSSTGIPAAVSAAAAADVALLVVGLDQSQESEGHDRTQLTMPGVQDELVTQVAAVAKRTVLVVLSGGAIDISPHVANPKIGAIVWAGYPGQAGGQALASILFGEVSPSGRLTQTWYPAAFNDVDFFDMSMRPNASRGYLGRTHRFYTGNTLFKFGDGLSYSRWEYTSTTAAGESDPTVRIDLAEAQQQLASTGDKPHTARVLAHVTVDVTNHGPFAAAHSAIAYLKAPRGVAGVGGAPIQSVAGFGRIAHLPVGQATPMSFELTAHHIAAARGYNAAGKAQLHAGEYTLVVAGADHPLSIHVIVA